MKKEPRYGENALLISLLHNHSITLPHRKGKDILLPGETISAKKHTEIVWYTNGRIERFC